MRNQCGVDILIVDDLPEKHLVYRAILDDLDQNIVSVTSGEEALLKLLERDFAVILLDVNMPRMSGLETAQVDPQRRKLGAHAHHLRHGVRRRGADGGRLCARRGRLHPVAGRPRNPACQNKGVRGAGADAGRARGLAREPRAACRERTAELAQSAERLEKEVLVRKSAEERLTIVVRELSHRVKNMLAVLQSIATRTLIPSRSAEEASEILAGRLHALGRAHELLVEASWSGAGLKNIVDAELAGFTERVRTDGPEVRFEPIRRADVRADRTRATHECGEVRRALQCQG